MERDFKGVWISREIWLNKELTLQEKIFFVEIDSLDNEQGCYASNAHFSEFFELSKNRCTEVIKSLEKKGLISVELQKKGKQISKRILRVKGIRKTGTPLFGKSNTPIRKVEHPYSENREGINTNINNTKERETRAHAFLNSKFPMRFQTVEMQNKKHVQKWDDLLEGFSDKVIIEKLEWDADILFARLGTYIRQWRSNEAGKDDGVPEVKAAYLRKIS